MILFKNYLIVLEYDPGTDILSVVWPNVEPYQLLEVERALLIMVETILNYDIKKLLIDASATVQSPEMDQVKYREIVTNFVQELTRTRLRKSARVVSSDKVREERSRQLSAEIVQDTGLIVESRNFLSREEALEWLMAPEPAAQNWEQQGSMDYQ